MSCHLCYLTLCFISASLLQALEKQQEALLHFREAVKLAPWNFEAQKGKLYNGLSIRLSLEERWEEIERDSVLSPLGHHMHTGHCIATVWVVLKVAWL